MINIYALQLALDTRAEVILEKDLQMFVVFFV